MPGATPAAHARYHVIARGHPGADRLQRQGMRLPVVVTGPRGRVRVQAMWDTGSEVSSVSAPLLRSLGAPESGSVAIYTVQGTSTVPDYTASLSILLPAGGRYPLSRGPLPLLGDTLSTGAVHVLIGREVQRHYRMVYDGPAGAWSVEARGGAGVEAATAGQTPARAPSAWPVVAALAALVAGVAGAEVVSR